MAATKITLGGVVYSVPMLNIGQIEEMAGVEDLPPLQRSLGTIRIALQRATPPIPDAFKEIETSPHEIGEAFKKILQAAGLTKADGPNEPAPGKAPGSRRRAAG